MKYLVSLLIMLLLIAIPVNATENPKTVLAIYMVGGDLEYDPLFSSEDNAQYKEAATKDIQEMLRGWGDGSDQMAGIVAYGGSKKAGWEGMTVATFGNLSEDLENGVIGDSEHSYIGWEDVNMGSKEGIETFLKYLKKTYPESRTILILWDHGFAYRGFGIDENHQNSIITPSILGSGMNSTRLSPELLGFDACFMADIEFLRIISPYVRYVVASEETEPDHGWDYLDLVSTLKANPDISAEEFGRKIIDSYLENSKHQKGALTLSLLDLTHIREVLDKFDSLASALDTQVAKPGSYNSLSNWAGKLYGLGASKDKDGNEMEMMVDLIALSRIAGEEIPGVSSEASALYYALQNLVVYSKHDTPITQIHGVGIFSPVMASHPVFYKKIGPTSIFNLSDKWIAFLNSFAEQIRADTSAPVLREKEGGYSLEEDGYALITDVFYQYQDDGSRIILGQEPSEVQENGIISKPEWDGTGLYIGDASSSSILPVYYVQTNDDGVQLYYAWGVLSQGNWKSLVRMDFWYNSASGALQWIVRPYLINESGEQDFSRSSATVTPGDTLTIYSRVISPDGALQWDVAGQVLWSEKSSVQKRTMPCGEYGMEVIAIDIEGNSGESGVIPYEIPC